MWVKNAKESGWQHPCVFYGLYDMKEIGWSLRMEPPLLKGLKSFLSNLWTWANLYSVDNTNFLLDFVIWMGE